MKDSAAAADANETAVVFMPDMLESNPYQARLAAALTKQGITVTFNNYPPLLGLFLRKQRVYSDTVIVHLHWINDLVGRAVYAHSGLRFKTWYLLVAIDLCIFRLRGGRLFWTVHNLISHECPNPSREKKMRRLIASFAEGIHFHSHSAVLRAEHEYSIPLRTKAIVAAHASYHDDYPRDEFRSESLATEAEIKPDNFTFLFFGNLRQYKGLEDLVDAFSQLTGSHYRLLVAGAPFPGSSVDWLKDASGKDPRIRLRIGYVCDLDVAALFAVSDVLAAPYIATLSSGVVSLGLTFGIPMVLPEAARVYDLPGEAGAEYFAPGHLPEALARVEKRDLSLMQACNAKLGQSLTWESMAETIAMAYQKGRSED